MKILILAAGFGTRLQKDIDENPEYSYISGMSKALLPIGGKPLIQHWIDFFRGFETMDDVFVITNDFYYKDFSKWALQSGFPIGQIINDGCKGLTDQKGSMGDILYFTKTCYIDDDLLIVGGDTLFPRSDLEVVKRMASQEFYKNAEVLYYENPDVDTKKVGIIEIDENQRVLSFLEKPDPDVTKSRLCCPCFYLMDKGSLHLVDSFIKETGKSDATGWFVQYLIHNGIVFGDRVEKRYDVGNLNDYKKTCKDFDESRI